MSFKRLLVKTRLTGKPMPDYVIVKDYGVKQGLVLFFPLDSALPGEIACWVATAVSKKPWGGTDSMIFADVPLEWFYKGRAPKKTETRIFDLLQRYGNTVAPDFIRVYKDRAEYRAYRESR